MKRCQHKHCLRKAQVKVDIYDILDHLEKCLKREKVPEDLAGLVLSMQEDYYLLSPIIHDAELCIKHYDELIGREFEMNQRYAREIAKAVKEMEAEQVFESVAKDMKKDKKTKSKSKGKGKGDVNVSVLVIKKGGKK